MYKMEIKVLGVNLNVELLILICVVYLVLAVHTLGGCCKINGLKEAFTGANTNFGESSNYGLNNTEPPVNPAAWNLPDMSVTPGQPLSQGVQDVLNRPKQPIPLPEGEMLMFSNTEFKPSCCPNTYSNSSGCACMTTDQFNHLVTRGGNNMPYSEY
jgi:hypothetical protein